MSEIMLPQIVQKKILTTNTNEVKRAKTEGYTILGDIAIAIEKNNTMLQDCTNAFSKYIASNINYREIKRYEENSNFWEKYVRNDSFKLQQLESKQEFINFVVANGLNFAVTGTKYAIVKSLDYFDAKKMKETLWTLSKKYANLVTKGNWGKYPSVSTYLRHLSNELFHKVKSVDEGIGANWDEKLVLPNAENYKNIAFVLFMIYSQKHLYQFDEESKLDDVALLYMMWERIGIDRIEAENLFNEFWQIDSTIGYDFVNTNIFMQGVVNNLSVALPSTNTKLVDELNREVLKYIPNGDTQQFSRRTAKFITKTAKVAGEMYLGVKVKNAALICEATKTALSWFDDLDDNEKIGNALEKLGMESEIISDCIGEAKAEIKKPGVAIVNVAKN